MTNYKDFKDVLDLCTQVNNDCDTLYDVGFNIIDSKLYDGFHRAVTKYFESNFNEEGVEWIEWYMYELPNFDTDKGPHAQYADGTPIDLSTPEKLWDFLQEYTLENTKEEKED